jgi:hypothetical protein
MALIWLLPMRHPSAFVSCGKRSLAGNQDQDCLPRVRSGFPVLPIQGLSRISQWAGSRMLTGAVRCLCKGVWADQGLFSSASTEGLFNSQKSNILSPMGQ